MNRYSRNSVCFVALWYIFVLLFMEHLDCRRNIHYLSALALECGLRGEISSSITH